MDTPLNTSQHDEWQPATPFVAAGSSATLVDQIVQGFQTRIDQGLMRAGMRLPSIRSFAASQKVSRFTVVEAYDRLVARGFVESRRGSGFFVRARQPVKRASDRHWAEAPSSKVDIVWLLRNMFKRMPPSKMPGAGVLPGDWLDAPLIAQSVRALGKHSGAAFLDYGHPQGYLPLREQLQARLNELEIPATSAGLLTTSGVTQGLDIVSQHFLSAGDTVLVDEPCWFLLFGRFATLRVNVVSVPRSVQGPDLAALEALMQTHKPRLFFTTAVLHNPTGTSMTGQHAHQVLRLAEKYDVIVVEDDVYSDLHPGGAVVPNTRLAALDGLQRVIYLGGFSKTLAANLRVGFIAASEPLITQLTDLKMLLQLTCSELGERVVYRVLSEGHYRRHLQRLRQRLEKQRDPVLRRLEKLGLKCFAEPLAGMYVWVDLGADASEVARQMMQHGYLTAPGSLFLPDQRASTWMRFNLATSDEPAMIKALASAISNCQAGRPRLGNAG